MEGIFKEKKNQIELLGMNTLMSEMKNTLDGINSTWDVAEEKMSELEGVVMETT